MARLTAAVEFHTRGFIRLGGFIEPSEFGGVRAEVESFLATPVPRGCERPNNTLAPMRWNDRPVQRLLKSERRLRALSEAVAARDLRWISGYVSTKAPHSGPVWWHQDWWCWAHAISYRPDAAQVAVLCYLTDTTADNGALRVLPGTHRRSVGLHAELGESEARGNNRHVAARDHPDQVTLQVAAGDAVAIDYRLLHGTHANETGTRRDCLLLNFAPAWHELPTEIRAHLIRHPALPTDAERAEAFEQLPLMPSFEGNVGDLVLSRVAPSEFTISRS